MHSWWSSSSHHARTVVRYISSVCDLESFLLKGEEMCKAAKEGDIIHVALSLSVLVRLARASRPAREKRALNNRQPSRARAKEKCSSFEKKSKIAKVLFAKIEKGSKISKCQDASRRLCVRKASTVIVLGCSVCGLCMYHVHKVFAVPPTMLASLIPSRDSCLQKRLLAHRSQTL